MHSAFTEDGEEKIPFAWSDRVLRDEVVQCLRRVISRNTRKDIISCGLLKTLEIDSENGHVNFTLELYDADLSDNPVLFQECRSELASLDWVNTVDISLGDTVLNLSPLSPMSRDALSHVKDIILISSCKGGVGKSTIAVNTAVLLAQRGAAVGLLDLDIFGCSLPSLLPQIKAGVLTSAGKLVPKEFDSQLTRKEMPEARRMGESTGKIIRKALTAPFGLKSALLTEKPCSRKVKVMSPGWLINDHIAMRGPLVSEMTTQLVNLVDWGELDYLIIDMPPGTGDVHLQIAELIPRAKFILLTTPHSLAYEDALKGYTVYIQAGLPCVGMVINDVVHGASKAAVWLNGRWLVSPKMGHMEPKWIEDLSNSVPTCRMPHSPELAICQFVVSEGSDPVGPWALAATLDSDFNGSRTSGLSNLSSFVDELIEFMDSKRVTTNVTPKVRIIGREQDQLEITFNLPGDSSQVARMTAQLLRKACQCKSCTQAGSHGVNAPQNLRIQNILEVQSGIIRVKLSDGHEVVFPCSELSITSKTSPIRYAGEW